MPVFGKGVGGGGSLGGGSIGGGDLEGGEVGGGEIEPGMGGQVGEEGGVGAGEGGSGGVPLRAFTISHKFLSSTSVARGALGANPVSRPNETRIAVSTDSASHTYTDWQIRRKNDSVLIYSFRAYDGFAVPSLAVLQSVNKSQIDIDLNRTYSYEFRIRENGKTWSEWKNLLTSTKMRSVGPDYKRRYVERQNSDGTIGVFWTNPKYTESKSNGRIVITQNEV